MTRSGSEPDGHPDLYRKTSHSNVSAHDDPDNDIPENMYRPEVDDPEGWIHRDKLAKIESEELQVAGINLANARRTMSKGVKRETSRGRRGDDGSGGMAGDYRRAESSEKRRRVSELVEEEEEDDSDGEEQEERSHWDLRSPAEIAADAAASTLYVNPVLRKSGSKIPVMTSSPLPIPQEQLERDTPLPRKRTMSNSMTPEDGLSLTRTRPRKGSSGSHQVPWDDADTANTPTPAGGIRSPPATGKTSSPTKSGPKTATASPPGTASGRKTTPASRKVSTTKTSTGATPSSSQRPGTRSGEMDRPRTAVNRPEGDPPWLATMYKPDPMLPPDQQIIPTHARRQQQAQWTEQGAIPSTYDRNFSPLAIHTGNGILKEPSPTDFDPASPKAEEINAWPLKPEPSIRLSHHSRPDTGSSITGGYSTMPKVTSPIRAHSPRIGIVSAGPPPNKMQTQRLPQPEMDEKEKHKNKGCLGCCVVM